MSAFTLKLLALVTMAIDHAGVIFYDSASTPYLSAGAYDVMRVLGRIAFPLYAFLLVEGFRHTHNARAYALRLLGLGALTQAVYALAIGIMSGQQALPNNFAAAELNILFTLGFGVVMLCFFKAQPPEKWFRARITPVVFAVFAVCFRAGGQYAIALLFALPAVLGLCVWFAPQLRQVADTAGRFATVALLYWLLQRFTPFTCDYGILGFGLIAALYLAHTRWASACVIAVWAVLCYFGMWTMAAAVLISCAVVLRYNGKRGPDDHRLFYWAYPAHLGILWGILLLLGG